MHLDKKVKLLDSPGIVFTNTVDNATALRNCIKIEKLDDPISPIGLILDKCNHEQLMQLYKIKPFKDATSFLCQIADKMGKLKKKGILDLEKAARTVLEDWNSGRIPYFTLPPAESADIHVGAEVPPVPVRYGIYVQCVSYREWRVSIMGGCQVVHEWANDFDIDSLVERNEQELDELHEAHTPLP